MGRVRFNRKALRERRDKFLGLAAEHRSNGNMAEADKWEAAARDCLDMIEEQKTGRGGRDSEHMRMMRRSQGREDNTKIGPAVQRVLNGEITAADAAVEADCHISTIYRAVRART